MAPLGVVASLTATPGQGQVVLSWTLADALGVDAVEVWASKTNDRATAAHFGDGNLSGFTHVVSPQGGGFFYWVRAVDMSRTVAGPWFPGDPLAGVQATHNNIPNLPSAGYTLINGSVVVSVAANFVTVAVKTALGADPSPADPIFVVVRNANPLLGDYHILTIVAPVSITTNGALAQGGNDPFRVWLAVFDNDGAPVLALNVAGTVNTIFVLPESGVANTTPSGISGVFHTPGIALVQKPYRLVAFMDWNNGLGSAGAWTVGPNVIALAGPATKFPGEIVQCVAVKSVSSGSFSPGTIIPADNTIPQSNEGSQAYFSTIKPTSPCNFLQIEAHLHVATSSGNAIAALFKDSDANALTAAMVLGNAQMTPLMMKHRRRSGTPPNPNGYDFTLRLSPDVGAATIFLSRPSAGAVFLTAFPESWFTLTEYAT
jgi:hypothetical protein